MLNFRVSCVLRNARMVVICSLPVLLMKLLILIMWLPQQLILGSTLWTTYSYGHKESKDLMLATDRQWLISCTVGKSCQMDRYFGEHWNHIDRHQNFITQGSHINLIWCSYSSFESGLHDPLLQPLLCPNKTSFKIKPTHKGFKNTLLGGVRADRLIFALQSKVEEQFGQVPGICPIVFALQLEDQSGATG